MLGFFLILPGGGVSWADEEPPGEAASDAEANVEESATETSESEDSEPYEVKVQWGGQLRAGGYLSYYDSKTFYGAVGKNPYYDGFAQFRLKNKINLTERASFETHYEAVLQGGDTRKKTTLLKQMYPQISAGGLYTVADIDDDRRLFDLTKTIDEDDRRILYHRIDRLVLTMKPDWGTVRLGRQALTWGNGLLFNPMDLFNPFAPTDVVRDYKLGDDMAVVHIPMADSANVQFLYVPRRNPQTSEVEGDQSSVAAKLHLTSGVTEFDLMAAKHYKDAVVGFGGSGNLGEAAWRLDATWTYLRDGWDKDGFLSLVGNLDYSWVWWDKNFYGFLEFYYNGLGEDRYEKALMNPDLIERLARGEVFTLGRAYLSGNIQYELHPLFNVFFTVINNLEDPSGVLQPRAVWDIAQNFQATFGANIYYGRQNTEYGGFRVPGTDVLNKSPNSAYMWFTYFF